MRAITISRFGAPDVLTAVDESTPEPGPGQVSIDVTHAAVGLADVLMRRGDFGGEPPLVPGLEVAGTIRALGGGVTGFRVGQPVVTLSRPGAGGYAEVSVADAGVTISLENTNLDPGLAVAALPNATTAVLALSTVAHLRAGQRLLVHGALGALSTVVARVGRHLGACEVVGTVRRTAQIATATAAGYDHVVLADDFAHAVSDLPPVDVVIDPVGGDLRRASLDALAPLGRLVCVGSASGTQDASFTGNDLWMANTAVLGLNTGGLLAEHPEHGDDPARQARQMLIDGIVSVDYKTLALEHAGQAHERLEQGGLRHRFVLTP